MDIQQLLNEQYEMEQNGTEWNVEWDGMLWIRGQDAPSLH